MRLLGIPRHFNFFYVVLDIKVGLALLVNVYIDKQYLLVGFFDIRDEIITYLHRGFLMKNLVKLGNPI